MKKLISILLSAILLSTVICAAPFTVSAAVEETEVVGASSGTTGDCTWTLDSNGTLTISGNGNMGNYDYTAPWGSNIKSVVIENGVTSIGKYAFNGCTGLTSVEIPDSVTSIGEYAFNGCTGLTSVTIGNGVTSIGYSAFNDCIFLTSVEVSDIAVWCRVNFADSEANPLYYAHNLYLNNELITDLNIPNSVTNIGTNAFYNCRGLTSVDIPDSVTSIGGYAFSGCTGLTSVTIPDSVTSIGYYAFSNTAWYTNQPNGLIYAGKVAYKYKGTMPANTSVVLKEGTKGISSSAFKGCTGLTSVTIGNGVTSIGWDAFSYCTGLTSVTIPDSVTSIGGEAFYNTAWYNNQPDGLIYAGKVAYKYKGTMPANTKIEIKEGTKGIAGSAFEDCTGLKSITIPDSVTSIGEYAFYGCTGLTSVTIPDSVTSIGGSAFSDCTGLKSVTIPDSVTSIG